MAAFCLSPIRGLAAVVTLAGLTVLCRAQQANTLEPPAEIRNRIADLRRNEGRAYAICILGGRDDAAPYLRLELAVAKDPLQRKDLTEALHTIERRTRERTRKRFVGWVADRRFDMCAETLSGWPDKKEACELIRLVTPALHQMGAEYARTHGLAFSAHGDIGFARRFDTVLLPEKHEVRAPHLHFAADSVKMTRAVTDYATVRADRCEIATGDILGWFVAVRSEIRYTPQPDLRSEWINSLVLVNNSMPVEGASSSLIICDGDVEWLGHWSRNHSLVIANGDIRVTGPDSFELRKCTLCATGDIVLPGRRLLADSRFVAGGTVRVGGVAVQSGRVQERQKVLPFGVRFLDPREFGLDLAADKAGLRVAGLAEWSPFAGHDLRVGDVIVRINGVAADTVPAFRRELRRGVIQESAVLHVRRGGETIGRIVFLDGIPTDPARVAPPPREVNR